MNKFSVYSVVALLALSLLAGCQLPKMISDIRAGANTPRQEGETGNLPTDWAQVVKDTVGTIFPPAAIPASFLALWAFGFIRGRKLKQGLPVTSRPATGFLGAKAGLEPVIQHLGLVVAGLFAKKRDGTLESGKWVIPLAAGIGAALLPYLLKIDAVFSLAQQWEPVLVALVGALTAAIAKAQQPLTDVLPVKTEPAS